MPVAKYHPRPIAVDAIRWTGEDNCAEVFAFLDWDHGNDESFHEEIYGIGDDETALIGDWILLGQDGEHHVMTDEDFRAVFEVADGGDRA